MPSELGWPQQKSSRHLKNTGQLTSSPVLYAPSVLEAKMLYKGLIMKESIVDPLFISGSLFQIILNNSSGFFAGSFKIAAIFRMVAVMLDMLEFVLITVFKI